MLYSITYYLEINDLNEKINETVKIELKYLFHAVENSDCWSTTPPKIHSLLDDKLFSATRRIQIEVFYYFLQNRSLNEVSTIAIKNKLVIRMKAIYAIIFATLNYWSTIIVVVDCHLWNLKNRLCFAFIKVIPFRQCFAWQKN